MLTCVDDTAKRMGTNRLQLKAVKPEILQCSSQCQIDRLPSQPFLVCSIFDTPISIVRDLGIWINNGLAMPVLIIEVIAGC